MKSLITVDYLLKSLLCSLLFISFFAAGSQCLAQDLQVVRVEEDWKMVLGEPEPQSVGPQVTCLISPVGNVDSLHAAFTLNHRGLPDFIPGGLQLQVWNDETPLLVKNFPDTSILSQTGETITWTQSMELEDGTLTFGILNGRSATWGNYGDDDNLKASVGTTLENLNQYDPSVSIKNSGIGFASNRVRSLVLVQVRLICSTGNILIDNTQRIVHQQDQQ
jgi:hypothetical protein